MENAVVFSVHEITRHLRQVIESSIGPLYVSGEISNYVKHSSGHIYFNLKDEYATLRCTYFKSVNYRLDFNPHDGMQVICYGRLTLFEKGGTYNLNVSSMQSAGLGQAQMRFEELKRKLQTEGLFDNAHKQALPKYPERIGIVTSPTGAALQDIRNVITRRYPTELLVFPALVQGPDAPRSLSRGIEYFNSVEHVDIIILTRGGGSQEDLYCFNDEALARTIYNSQIPVVSAVGHEIDFTIADFVADHRAPTPSAAAEIVVPNRNELNGYLKSVKQRLALLVKQGFQSARQKTSSLNLKLQARHPERVMAGYRQRYDLAAAFLSSSDQILRQPRHRLELHRQQLNAIRKLKLRAKIMAGHSSLSNLEAALNSKAQSALQQRRLTLKSLAQILTGVSPRNMMERGWTIATLNGRPVSRMADLNPEDDLQIQFYDGVADTQVKELHPEPQS